MGVLRELLILLSPKNFKLNRFVMLSVFLQCKIEKYFPQQKSWNASLELTVGIFCKKDLNYRKEATPIEVMSQCKSFMIAKVSHP